MHLSFIYDEPFRTARTPSRYHEMVSIDASDPGHRRGPEAAIEFVQNWSHTSIRSEVGEMRRETRKTSQKHATVM